MLQYKYMGHLFGDINRINSRRGELQHFCYQTEDSNDRCGQPRALNLQYD
jgi:hypothetical protein